MHELSIVTYVVKQVQEIAKENNLTEIESVTLEFGEVSGIVPEYLEDCWNWYTKKEPIIQGTKFLYEIIPAVTWCDDCKQTYPTVQYGKTCPHCGSGKTWLQQAAKIHKGGRAAAFDRNINEEGVNHERPETSFILRKPFAGSTQ